MRMGEGERVQGRMIAEHLLEHGIGPGFSGIQEGHSAFQRGQGDAARAVPWARALLGHTRRRA